MQTKKGVLFLLGLLVFTMGCNKNDREDDTGKLVLGAIYNLTGNQAALDVPSSMGAELAVQQANDEGGVNGKPLRLILKDGQTDPTVLNDRVAEVLDEAPATSAFLGLSDTDQVLAAAGAAAAQQRVFLTSGATSPQLPAQVPDYLFLACFGDNVQAAAAAEWAYDELGARTVSIMFDSTTIYTRSLQGYFADRFEQMGGQVLVKEAYGEGSIASSIQAIQPSDFVFFAALPQDALEGVRLIRQSGFSGPVIGGDAYDEPDTWQKDPQIADVYFTTHAYLGADNPSTRVQAFRQAYMQAYHEEPNAFAALGYDAAQLLIEALETAAGPAPEEVRQALASIRNFPGVTGTISFGPDSRIPGKSVTIMEIKNGTQQFVTQWDPEEVPEP